MDDVGVRRNSRKRKTPRSLLLNDAWKASDALEAWLFNDVGEGKAQQLYAQDALDLSSCWCGRGTSPSIEAQNALEALLLSGAGEEETQQLKAQDALDLCS